MNPFEHPISTLGLRKCQQEAYAAIHAHFAKPAAERHILVQLPTGAGKSALIAAMGFGLANGKVLILVPNVKLSKDMEKDLDIIHNPQSSYARFGIIPPADLADLQLFVLRLDGTINKGDIDDHQIIVANYQQLHDVEKWFKDKKDAIDLIVIDEAHHQSADTYQEIIRFFDGTKIVGLTATPFRSDGQKVDGLNVYTYHFYQAIADKIIRNIHVSNVTPEQIELSFADEAGRTYSLAQILELKEDAWFRRGIAMSPDCCSSIAKKAYEKLQVLRSKFPTTTHQIIASAISIRHAREFVKPAFESLGLKVGMVSSDGEDSKKNDQVLTALDQGKIDVIINVGMLGEGFDHPHLGVAAIFRPYKSLNPYMQFVGRVIRRNEPADHCFVVSHLGLNQNKRFEEFRLFDHADQEFLKNLLEDESKKNPDGDMTFVPEEGGETDAANQEVHIKEMGGELMDFESKYVQEDQKIEQLKHGFGGLSEEGKMTLLKDLGLQFDSVTIKAKLRTKPVDERKAAKNLLNEREKSIATDIVSVLGFKNKGRHFNPMYTDMIWIRMKVGREVNVRLGIAKSKRKDLTNAQFETIEKSGMLDEVKAVCMDYFKKKAAEKEEKVPA